jgi:tetraacyldisaccharide 4'-kinase
LSSDLSLERRVLRFWYGKSILAILLQPAAYIFQAMVALRRGAYRFGLLSQEAISAPVVVIGNITVGGTGKTPLVAWLARQLREAGYRPGIVSRGYGGRANRQPLMVNQAGNVAEVGDEALVLARQTQAPICICTDRVAAARHLLAKADVDIVIADDGLQHYRLGRDLEIAVLDGDRMLGNGRLLPAGPLRESSDRLREVDLVFINGEGDRRSGDTFRLVPAAAIELQTSTARALGEFRGTRVWAVAGIGNPERFYRMLESFDIEPIRVDIPDHGAVSLKALRQKEDCPILMTEKDAVKYLADPVADAWYVPVAVDISDQAKSAVMKRIQEIMDHRMTSD